MEPVQRINTLAELLKQRLREIHRQGVQPIRPMGPVEAYSVPVLGDKVIDVVAGYMREAMALSDDLLAIEAERSAGTASTEEVEQRRDAVPKDRWVLPGCEPIFEGRM